jgi:beta-lactamase class A
MNLPNADRLYTSTPGVPSGTEVYDKTGTTSHLCGNIGILVAQRADGASFPYIVVGVIEKGRAASGYFGWMRSRGDVIRRVSEMAYEAVSGQHKFDEFSPGPSSGGDLAQDSEGGTASDKKDGTS